MAEIIYPELSYKLVGVLFATFNALGGGLQEKIYQRAVKLSLMKQNIPFLEQVRYDIDICGEDIGRYYIDFVIDHKIALELKARKFFVQSDIRQLLGYLKRSKLELGLLVRFGLDGVEVKRMLRGNK